MTKQPNQQRNEIIVTLGELEIKCKLSFDTIVKIEDLFDATIFQIVQDLNAGKIRANKVADVIEIAMIEQVTRDAIEEAIVSTGSVDSLTAIVPLLLSAFAGNKKQKVDEKKV